MSTSPEASPMNGHNHDSMSEHMDVDNEFAGNQSESDLSDVQLADAEAPSSDSADVADSAAGHPVVTGEDPSEASDNDASEDADFDMADSPASHASEEDHEDHFGNLTLESRPAPKRKPTQAAEEDFMRENPELYGLRRSVCCPLSKTITMVC